MLQPLVGKKDRMVACLLCVILALLGWDKMTKVSKQAATTKNSKLIIKWQHLNSIAFDDSRANCAKLSKNFANFPPPHP